MFLLRQDDDPSAWIQVLGTAKLMPQEKSKSFWHNTMLLFTLPGNQDCTKNSNEMSVLESSNL